MSSLRADDSLASVESNTSKTTEERPDSPSHWFGIAHYAGENMAPKEDDEDDDEAYFGGAQPRDDDDYDYIDYDYGDADDISQCANADTSSADELDVRAGSPGGLLRARVCRD